MSWIAVLRSLHDWSVLADILDGQNGLTNISTAKVAIYEQHKKDLATLKYFIRKYCPEKYNAIFKDAREDNYVAYSYHYNNKLDGQIKKESRYRNIFKIPNQNNTFNKTR